VEPGDQRRVFVVLPNGYPLCVPSLAHAPAEARWWCREGDKEWQPLNGGGGDSTK
jgi:hypothetical protein